MSDNKATNAAPKNAPDSTGGPTLPDRFTVGRIDLTVHSVIEMSGPEPFVALRRSLYGVIQLVREHMRDRDEDGKWWAAARKLDWLLRSEDPISDAEFVTKFKGCAHCGCKKVRKVSTLLSDTWKWVPECTECRARGPVAFDIDGPMTMFNERVEVSDKALGEREREVEAAQLRIRLFERRARETIELLESVAEREIAEGNGANAYPAAAMADVYRHLLAEGGHPTHEGCGGEVWDGKCHRCEQVVEADEGSGS